MLREGHPPDPLISPRVPRATARCAHRTAARTPDAMLPLLAAGATPCTSVPRGPGGLDGPGGGETDSRAEKQRFSLTHARLCLLPPLQGTSRDAGSG